MMGHDTDAWAVVRRWRRRARGEQRGTRLAILYVILLPLVTGCADLSARVEGFKAGRLQTHATADLKRGINFGDAMDAPNEGDWGWTISAADFQTVRAAGFDHVR